MGNTILIKLTSDPYIKYSCTAVPYLIVKYPFIDNYTHNRMREHISVLAQAQSFKIVETVS